MKKYLVIILSICIMGCSTSKDISKDIDKELERSNQTANPNNGRSVNSDTYIPKSLTSELSVIAQNYPELQQIQNDLENFDALDYFSKLDKQLKNQGYDVSGKSKFVSVSSLGVFIIITELYLPSKSYDDYISVETRIATNTALTSDIMFSTVSQGLFVNYTDMTRWSIFNSEGRNLQDLEDFNTIYELNIRKQSLYENNLWSPIENKKKPIYYLVNKKDENNFNTLQSKSVNPISYVMILLTDSINNNKFIKTFYKSN